MTSQESDPQPEEFKATLSDIKSGVPQVSHKTEPDQKDVLEVSTLEDDMLREQIENLRSDRALREKYADRILAFLEAYAVLVFFLILFDGLGFVGFSIPEAAIVTLVGSTAVAAIGLVGFVAKGLFK
ncbi:hypothetical protein [Ponticoccus alexandrii]|uniref:DUF2335 domain-containing protein n=1 Tax=Ponticoccus alexandrii TaxID=1943633 RepID=A0ABX7FDK6_9RHOB|nr:hypothetical protein [Ponticoccus alexandrii]QRF68144.1 hypothetical protein GQA70_18605 [Ponticoccus alexandrii]